MAVSKLRILYKETMDMETAFTRELAMEDDMEEDDEDQ